MGNKYIYILYHHFNVFNYCVSIIRTLITFILRPQTIWALFQ